MGGKMRVFEGFWVKMRGFWLKRGVKSGFLRGGGPKGGGTPINRALPGGGGLKRGGKMAKKGGF